MNRFRSTVTNAVLTIAPLAVIIVSITGKRPPGWLRVARPAPDPLQGGELP